jgi:hypothetical protein
MKTITIVLAAVLIINSSWTTPTIASFSSTTDKTQIVKTTLNESFSFFRTHRQGKAGITATWGLFSNTGVTEFVLQRTYEDPSDPYAIWDEVCTVECNNNRSFKATDSNVVPGFISYRVIAMNGLTQVDVSDISTEHIVQH